ncbi:sugar ABC transporter permease [Deinococcus sp.]|uniref:carbohydrate ABC transporter permease n=1 Tax=Deinococcus sp. TaxID=47478 RepID=UPI00286E61D9|nr:sugar ABC transporter permease [Deinococcus sp.]
MHTRFRPHIAVFLLPAVLIYSLFMIYPLITSLWLSLNNQTQNGPVHFVGLANYVRLFQAPEFAGAFWNALWNNVKFFLIHMAVQNPVGVLLAVLLSRQLVGTAFYRTVIFTPAVLSVVIIGFAWRLILNPQWGFHTTLLGLPGTALITVALISVWQNVGIPMMLFTAALMRIPEEFYEAARVDGATPWRVFRSIQLPLLLPTLGIVGILTFVGNFNAFDLIYATQGALGGPNFSTDLLGTLFYRTYQGFQLQLGDPYMGSTIAGAMLLIILAGVLIYLIAWQRRIQDLQF